MREEKYLQLLAKDYPTMESAKTEIINLSAICALPKGTEYFFSDLHGEHEAFIRLLRSASGVIRAKIRELFDNTLTEAEQNQLANLIYNPEKMLQVLQLFHKNSADWQKVTIYRLVTLCKEVSSKYTRSKVRKKMPPEYAYIIDELLHVSYSESNKKLYYGAIVNSIIDTDSGDSFIMALCNLIQSLSIDSLHIIGDIFDRGPRPDAIVNELMKFHDVDIQWGNHDMSWMGAASGNRALMANVVRMGISYNTFDGLEDGYGINLRALSEFASRVYKSDPCERFQIKILDENQFDRVDVKLAAKMHKAIAIIQFKLVGQLIKRNPEFEMDDRNVLEHIDYEKGIYHANNGKDYPLLDTCFPTIDPKNPLQLTEGEEALMNSIAASFRHSEVLHRHMRFIHSHGSTYTCVNSNLLFHGCIPMDENGEFLKLSICGVEYVGKEMMEHLNEEIHNAYFLPEDHPDKQRCRDFMWYLWCGAKSPMFGKSQLSAFENYFVEEKEIKKEIMNPYYKLSESEEICNKIFKEFGLNPATSHIINGHVPVKIKDGEKPIKANGKLYVIDGGISKAYQSKTGIAGYTLIFNSRHLALAEHRNYMNMSDSEISHSPEVTVEEPMPHRIMMADTDQGKKLLEQIEDLKALVRAYQTGALKEQTKK
ncbi:MAG: fructose-1,6-bisphosphatase [Lachnospiraceae bacterium]